MNIAQLVDRAAQQFPDRPAIVADGTPLTYRELRARVDRVAYAVMQRGIRGGERIGLMLPNIAEFAIVYLAAQKLGVVVVSLNVMLTSGEVHYLVEDCGPRLLFTNAALLPAVQALVGAELDRDQVILCEGNVPGYATLDQFGAADERPFATQHMAASAPAAILYTSGTTGRQKGATLSHGNVLSNVHAVRECLHIEPGDRLLSFLPLFHCYGQNFIMNSGFASGATLVMQRRFQQQRILDSIEADGVTMFFGVPTTYIALLDAEIAPERLRGVRYYFSAAAPLPADVAERWQARYGRPIHEGYGLTETSPFATYNHEWMYRPGSQGTAIPLVDVRIVDENDEPLPAGQWGEICIQGPNVMLGYWNRQEATREALRGGWFHSGDVGYLDDAGYLFVVDRTKDMVNSAGFKIWPREVEEVIYEHPSVLECAVVGVPDSLKGEVAIAYVIPTPGATLAADQLEAFCRARLATYKILREFAFTQELPKSGTGKILKRVLRDQFARQL